jgi:hypothetical protein
MEAQGFTPARRYVAGTAAPVVISMHARTILIAVSLTTIALLNCCALADVAAGTGSVGVNNKGFWGMNLQAGQVYDLSFYARCATGFTGSLTVHLESADGNRVYA